VHLDGYDQRDVLAGTWPGKRHESFCWTDDGNVAAVRYDRWKRVFLAQRAEGLAVWQNPPRPLRAPNIFCMRTNPFEWADHHVGGYDH
jgi:arylsulfatase